MVSQSGDGHNFTDIWGDEHEVGNKDCAACRDEAPVSCSNCGGLKHVWFVDEDWDSVWFGYRCEVCGDNSRED